MSSRIRTEGIDSAEIADGAIKKAHFSTEVTNDYATKDFARAQASIFVHWDGTVNPTGGVRSVTVGSGGTGYTNGTAVTFSGGGGSGAAGTINVSSGVITSVSITSQGIGYTSAPTVSVTGGSGASLTAVIEIPISKNRASTFGTGFTTAWDSSNNRWKVMDNSLSPKTSNIRFSNGDIDWSHFSCHIDSYLNAASGGNANGALSFRFGDNTSAGVGWAGSGTNGAGLWYNRLYGGDDDQWLLFLMTVNDTTYRSTLGNQVQGQFIKSSGTGSPITYHNGAKTSTQSLAGNTNVGFLIPATSERNKVRLVGAGNKFLIYVDGTLYVEIILNESIPTSWGPIYSFVGDNNQVTGKLCYIYEVAVGSPDPADLMAGYKSELPPVSTTAGNYTASRQADGTIIWQSIADGNVREITMGTSLPATADDGSLHILSEPQTSGLTYRLAKVSKTYESSQLASRWDSTEFQHLSSRFMITLTGGAEPFEDLVSGDKIEVLHSNDTRYAIFTLTASPTISTVNGTKTLTLTSSQYTYLGGSGTLTQGSSYTILAIGSSKGAYANTLFARERYWYRLWDGTPSVETVPFGDNWETLWSDSSGYTTLDTDEDLDSGKSFSDYSILMFRTKSSTYSDHQPKDEIMIRTTFETRNFFSTSDNSNISIKYIDSNTFQVDTRYNNHRVYEILGHK